MKMDQTKQLIQDKRNQHMKSDVIVYAYYFVLEQIATNQQKYESLKENEGGTGQVCICHITENMDWIVIIVSMDISLSRDQDYHMYDSWEYRVDSNIIYGL